MVTQTGYASSLAMEATMVDAPPIRVLRASREVAERMRAAPRDAGRVHSTFEHALNIEWHDGRLLTLHGPGPLRAPFAAALAQLPRSPALCPGCPVRRRDDALAIDGASLDPRGAVCVDTTMPAAGAGVPPLLARLPSPSRTAGGLFSTMGRRARARLAAGVSSRDPVPFIEGALELVGLGEGLTPAGDDCLVGALAALHRFVPSWLSAHPEIESTVMQAASVGTTSIAREFIVHALAGHFAESLIRLLCAASEREVATAVAQLLESGATSGADTLYGVRLAVVALGAPTS